MQVPHRKAGKFTHLTPDPLITQTKFDELTKRLDGLKAARPRAAAEVARLAELGDFSENVEYQLAKGKLRGINQGITDLEKQLINARVFSPKENTDVVQLGHTVIVESEGIQKTFQILGSTEIKPGQGIISHHSPLGAALMGKGVGDTVEIQLPNNILKTYTIINIT
jgi:transcription elongation GreA/GreB family factor